MNKELRIFQELETERLFIREFSDSNYNDLCEILQDKDVMYAYDHVFSDDEVKSMPLKS